ncbi:cobalt ABC transporter permease [Thalassobius sp. Cn5-15]|uniref:cobalt ABC transporter permease n=1 Tax=Thalassobius sp. Cn5-15 TaxID=2917763 RepID=UPI001EF1842C|nr:cobalt ABC transporter permease [Thalassobius sp. Cn5-15]MCG7493528.1 cobalt ABC transporter permease [Thalassobius sp. Cn5-15]
MIRTKLLALTVSATLMAPLPALAHKVISSVFPSGDAIEGEVGFSNGDMAVDLQIDVFDEAGTKLGEARTDADGFFIYTPTKPVTHIFRGDLGAGHVAEITMPAEDVADIMGVAAEASPAVASTAAATAAPATALSQDTEAAIAEMLRRELRPLRQEITALKNETNFQSILGGIGYIVGLFGLGFYIAARRQIGGK